MKRIFIFSLLSISMLTSAMAQNPDFNGSWKGAIEAGPYSLTLVFHIEQNGDNVSFSWDSPDQGGFGLPGTATINGNELNVDIPDYNASYHGTLKGDTLDGTFTQGGDLPLRMTRKMPMTMIRTPAPRKPLSRPTKTSPIAARKSLSPTTVSPSREQ